MPNIVDNGARPLTRLDLLDMVCSALADWVVMISVCVLHSFIPRHHHLTCRIMQNAGHIECREPAWTVGPKRIFFKDMPGTSRDAVTTLVFRSTYKSVRQRYLLMLLT